MSKKDTPCSFTTSNTSTRGVESVSMTNWPSRTVLSGHSWDSRA
jgi:hypothetical protein